MRLGNTNLPSGTLEKKLRRGYDITFFSGEMSLPGSLSSQSVSMPKTDTLHVQRSPTDLSKSLNK